MTDTTPLRNQLAERAQTVEPVNGSAPLTIAQLIDRQRSEIARALPKHMDPDRLARIATTTIKATPRLLECTSASLLGALMLSAQTGMEPGPLGHAYLVPRRNKGVMECQWQLGYKGIIELARRSGKIKSIEAREVCEADRFEFAYGLDEKLIHEPYMGGERGAIVAFWGLAKFTDGGHYFLVMSKSDVDKARERSDSARNGGGPWSTDYAAMGRKTVIRRMAPFLPLSAEQAQVMAYDEQVNTRVAPALTDEPPAAGWIEGESWEQEERPALVAAGDEQEPADGAEEPPPFVDPICCAVCGLSLAGCAVKIEGGRKVHKDGCPTGSGPDDPGPAEKREHEPNATTGLEREPIDEPDAVPAASGSQSDESKGDLDVLKLCGEVFKPARDAAPRGEKTRTDERLRHCMCWAVSAGRTVHLKALTAAEKHQLYRELTWLKEGHRQWEATADALILTRDDEEIVLPFADIESEAA